MGKEMMRQKTMNENEVVLAVVKYLEKEGYTDIKEKRTHERGDDIDAQCPKKKPVYVEAKGGTSSKEGSARFGKPFHSVQIRHIVAEGFFACAKLRQKHPKARVILALCNSITISENVNKTLDLVKESLKKLGIEVFLVDNSGIRTYGK